MSSTIGHDPTKGPDPVYLDEQNGGWFFYDETGAHSYGPYQSEAEARQACKEYAATL
jgi:hypothetical protein